MFISFEGIDESGKTTQIQLLANYLREKGFDVCVTREPGGTSLGQNIRKILLDENSASMHPHTELCLLVADRVQHIHECIAPSLDKGQIVLCDRFIDSTIAYQGASGLLDTKFIENILKVTGCFDLWPDITFLLDMDMTLYEQRISKTGQDRFTERGCSYMDKVRQAYLHLAQKNSERICLVDASLELEVVFERIKDFLHETSFFLA